MVTSDWKPADFLEAANFRGYEERKALLYVSVEVNRAWERGNGWGTLPPVFS